MFRATAEAEEMMRSGQIWDESRRSPAEQTRLGENDSWALGRVSCLDKSPASWYGNDSESHFGSLFSSLLCLEECLPLNRYP